MIRVGSDFHFMGMQVLHSRDRVDWEVVGQVLSRSTATRATTRSSVPSYREGAERPGLRARATPAILSLG